MSRAARAQAGPSVTVVGAGVAGLTAAQALADRGFTVFVVESAPRDGGGSDMSQVRLGGVASSNSRETSGLFALESGRQRHTRRQLPRLGFRQIPRHYRHVRDVLSAIPIDSGHQDGVGRTVLDSLRTVPANVLGDQLRPFLLPEGTSAGIGEGSGAAANGMPSRKDLLVYSCRLLRYMSTSSERRRAECEHISFAEYVRGHNSRESGVPLTYEERFLKALDRMPRGLAIIDPAHTDARTALNLVEQIVFDLVSAPSGVDVLGGPTDESWFLPWQRHLVRLGVTFHQATLEKVVLEQNRVRLHFTRRGRAWRGSVARVVSDADYVVLAVDVVSAERLTRDLPDIGVASGLRGYTTIAPRNPRDGPGARRRRDPQLQSALEPADRLQCGVGLQFYFREDVELLHGLTYVSGSPWSLITLMEPGPRVRRGSTHRDEYRFVLRVEICAWNTPGLAGAPASQSARHDVAVEAWRQIKAAAGATDGGLADPAWYSVDRNVRFADARQGTGAPAGDGVDGEGIPISTLTPYLMPVAGDWDARPSADPWDPRNIGTAQPLEPRAAGLWQAEHGGYLVHWDRLVFAGAYPRTFTRLTTMESACESARHAVNAILDHREWVRTAGRRSRGRRGMERLDAPLPAAPDYCRVWNLEQSVAPEQPTKIVKDLDRVLSLARSVDRQAFGLGRPHCWEALLFDQALAVVSKGAASDPTAAFGDFFKSYSSKLQGLAGRAGTSDADWVRTLVDTLKSMSDLKQVLAALESLLHPTTPPGRRP